MKPSRVLLASVFITAVILAMVGGITSLVMAQAKSAASQQPSVQVYQQREAEYQKLIQQANQQLAEANQKLQEVQGVSVSTGGQQSAAAAPASVAIAADKAEQLARQAAAPAQPFQKPGGLVSFQGKAAYEFDFLNGAIYVDAQNGDILFNGTVPQEINIDKAVQIASDYLKNKDVVQSDQITFRGAQVFRVFFKPGIMVFVDKTGQIIYMQKLGPRIIIEQVSSGGGGGGGGAPASTGGGFFENDHNGGNDN